MSYRVLHPRDFSAALSGRLSTHQQIKLSQMAREVVDAYPEFVAELEAA